MRWLLLIVEGDAAVKYDECCQKKMRPSFARRQISRSHELDMNMRSEEVE